jgi:peptidoglycan-N-acetylglucosamine deacetylase
MNMHRSRRLRAAWSRAKSRWAAIHAAAALVVALVMVVGVTQAQAAATTTVEQIGSQEAVAAPPAITITSLPPAGLGTPYSATVGATGGLAPYAWSISQGSLPQGLSLNSATGVISGTPELLGTSSFTLQVTDAQSPPALATRQLSVNVGSAAVAAEGTDGAMWAQAPQLPSGWQSLGGRIIAAPAVAAVPQSSGVDSPLFIATGTDHSLWIRSLDENWTSLTPGLFTFCLDNPAAVVTGSASAPMLTVACQGANHGLWAATVAVPSSGLPSVGAWTNLGGSLGAGPAVAPVNGVITYFVTASFHNGQVWTRTNNTNWEGTSLFCIGHPAAAIAQGGTTTWFGCQGGNGQAWDGALSDVTDEGGAIVPGPGLGITSADDFMFAEASFGSHSVWFRTPASNWVDLGGSVVNGVGAVGLFPLASPVSWVVPGSVITNLDTAPGSPYTGGQKVVALTFDDGPNPPYTQEILQILAQDEAPATFLINGVPAVANPAIVQEEVDLGMPIGNHTWTHVDLTTTPAAQWPFEVDQTTALIQSFTAQPVACLRPPYGAANSAVTAQIGHRGMAELLWDIDPGDWAVPQPPAITIAERVLSDLVPGGIVLLHDGPSGTVAEDKSQTVAALPMIISGIRAAGYQIVPVC